MEKGSEENRKFSIDHYDLDGNGGSFVQNLNQQEILRSVLRLESIVSHQNSTINDLKDTIGTLHLTINSQNSTINDLRGTLNDLRGTLNSQNSTINDLRGTLNSQNSTINDLRGTIDILHDSLKKKDDDIGKLKTKINTFQDTLKKKDDDIGKLETKINTFQDTLKKKDDDIGKLEAKLETIQKEFRLLTRQDKSSEKGRYMKDSESLPSSNGNSSGGGSGKPPKSPKPSEGDDDSNAPEKHCLNQIKYENQLKRLDLSGLASGKNFKIHWQRQEYLREIGSEYGLLPAAESFHNMPIFTFIDNDKPTTLRFSETERMAVFGKTKGLHSSYDNVVRWGLELVVTKNTYRHETLSDYDNGKTSRKDPSIGPAGTQLTWESLNIITQMHSRFCIPQGRIAHMIGKPYFSSSNISRWLLLEITWQEIIYSQLGKDLSNCNYFNMDDTSTLVLDMHKEAKSLYFKADAELTGEELDERKKALHPIVGRMAEQFGRVSMYADGSGGKRKVNLTVIIGQTDSNDSRSTIIFYRTHFGQAGNLLSRIVENRKKRGKIYIQGDSSAQNHLEKNVAEKLEVTYIGCMHHARRPFVRYRDKDEDLCYYLLRAFAVLSYIERKIFDDKVTKERILKLRTKASLVWISIKSVAEEVIAGHSHKYAKNKIWKDETRLYNACQYILNNYTELTFYLTHAEVKAANIASERLLRIDVMLMNASQFIKTEKNRIATDIIRSLMMTCEAAEVDYNDYMRYMRGIDIEKIRASPKSYTPYAYSTKLREAQVEMDQKFTA